jgi:cell wall-associated NlpC family hydrolase
MVSNGSIAAVIQLAREQIGKPYVWGGKGPNVFDCSGLLHYAYLNAAGIEIGGYTGEQINHGSKVAESELQPGDLVFTRADLGHVQMYIGGGMVIHAPRSGYNVEIVPLTNFYTARRIIG